MSNWLLRNPDVVFIHIPKTGGSTIRKGIWGKANMVGPVYGHIPPQWRWYWKVAFVRHPLDRFASGYRDFAQLRRNRWQVAEFLDIVMNDRIPYVEPRTTRESEVRHHLIPQTHPYNNLDKADTVYHYETYARDLDDMLKRVDKKVEKIPHYRPTDKRGLTWQEILTGSLLEQAIEYYYDDFIQLGYEVP